MRKIIILLFVFICCLTSCSNQSIATDKTEKANSPEPVCNATYQLFPTQNMWTFILLDSYNGRLWQVQYSTQDLDNLFCIPINKYELVSDNENCIFSIQPLTSMYQYYLINDRTGDIWKFQWSTKGDDYRWIEKFK